MPAFEGIGLACKVLPLRQCCGASFATGLAVDELAFETEVVVDVGINGGDRECQAFCAKGRYRHRMTNRAPKTTANWVFASDHSRAELFHS